jgi:hypothetical protein
VGSSEACRSPLFRAVKLPANERAIRNTAPHIRCNLSSNPAKLPTFLMQTRPLGAGQLSWHRQVLTGEQMAQGRACQ